MRNRSLIKTVFVLFILLWALYALWPTYQVEKLTPEKRSQLVDEGKLVPLEEKAIRLGLDLKGGMYIKIEVDLPALAERLAENKDEQFEAILTEVREEMNISTIGFLDILQAKFKEKNVSINRYWGNIGDSDREIIKDLRDAAKDAMDRTKQILTNRIDQFGVSEPSIQTIGGRQILIQLPGMSDPERARNLINKTALLEFRLLKDPIVFREVLRKIDNALAKERGVDVADVDTEDDSTVTEQPVSQDKVVSVNELFGEDEADLTSTDTTDADTSLLVDERIFEENPFLALFRNIRQGGNMISAPVENIKAINKILKREDIQKLVPQDAEFLWASQRERLGDNEYLHLYLVKREAELTGEYLKDARVDIGQDANTAGQPVVNFTLNRRGGREIARVSKANLQKQMPIVLDGRVVSAPFIRSELGAQSQISNIGSMEEAKDMAIILKAGALPVSSQIVEERTVGPSLGNDSVQRGKYSAMLGMGIIILFMIIYYRMAGLIADAALIMNLLVLLAILAQFRFTLTLPGVAGIVLTIGMAVDANVLVFERIREELRTGKTVRAAIDAGYSRAFRTILDANVTTLLTALVLYQFGTGPIRGFAVTLSIGILVSMFTALVVTRLIFSYITGGRTLTKLSI